MRVQPQPLNEITKQAIEVLCQQIGLVNTVRFINQFTTGYGNYTEEREQLFADMTLDEVISEIEEMRDQGIFDRSKPI
ncbi:hypothetical protein THIOM_002653 [Candidatus Thiomargarita nelsonii]|uniref:Uncharacterized protein n=1 Tax=Candidatus Thiomargarita nelsonii TaxID=1003181 RepID=A0A176S0I6_9GAMM|nr:hypothetical protein THIOM_002653 [Candidatus Thiomargarita nelsonii]